MLDVEFERNPEIREQMERVVPIERPAECEEVADTITFLLSPAASYINATSVVVDAAVTATLRMY